MPIVIFGTRGRVVPDDSAQSTTEKCNNCGQIVSLKPVLRKRYFSLFFIPIIPLEKGSAAMQCPNCKILYQRRES
ncbi:MAG: zinc-ribbon domain-containing protein [Chloroflexi bacterium]|nr:zinc-ribbon domain-containing protein [Chloroflexota bacterium]